MAMALLRRLLAISVLVGVPLGSLWVVFGDYIPVTIRPPRVAGEEETPYLVYVKGMERYRDVYVRDGDSEDRARARLGRLPFDLPSAEACLEPGSLAEQDFGDQELAWSLLPTPEAIEVCLARTLNRFSDSDVALAWLQDQGLALTDTLADIDSEGRTKFVFGWSPQSPGGPQAWWQGLPAKRRTVMAGLEVTVEICDRGDLCRQLDDPVQRPPFFHVLVQSRSLNSK